MAKHRIGFLSFGADDEDIALQDSLTQAAGTEVSYATDPSGGQIIDSGGFDANNLRARTYPISTGLVNYANLYNQFHISFEISTGLMKRDYVGGDNYYISSTGGRLSMQKISDYNIVSINNAIATARSKISVIGKGSMTRVDIVGLRGVVSVFYDYLRMSHGKITSGGDSSFWASLYVGGFTTLTGYIDAGFKIMNLQVSFRPQSFPVSTEYGSILFVGTSFVTGGSFPTPAASVTGETWPEHCGYGYNSAGAAITNVSDSYYDVNVQPTIIRELSRHGIWTNNNKNYGKSGGEEGLGDIATYQTRAFTDGHRPKVIFCESGTNDAALASATLATRIAAFETYYKARLTEANSKGVKHYVMANTPSLRANPTYRTADYDKSLAMVNDVIGTVYAWSKTQGFIMQTYYADIYTLHGGAYPNLSHFNFSDIHRSEYGSYLAGVCLANSLLS